jgi:hypothetical protein
VILGSIARGWLSLAQSWLLLMGNICQVFMDRWAGFLHFSRSSCGMFCFIGLVIQRGVRAG